MKQGRFKNRWIEEDRGYESLCWVWQLGKSSEGYGFISTNPKRKQAAHRAIYEWDKGSIPDDLVLDHLCRQKDCVNPDHLEPVTNGENLRRAHGCVPRLHIGFAPRTSVRKAHTNQIVATLAREQDLFDMCDRVAKNLNPEPE